MDITKYVGDTKHKEKNNTTNLRVYFDPIKDSVHEELKTQSDIPTDVSIKFCVRQNFKSFSHIKLPKDLREDSGQCGFNIIQKGIKNSSLRNQELVKDLFSMILTLKICLKTRTHRILVQ